MPITFEQLTARRIIPVAAIDVAEAAVPLARALVAGGLPVLEVPLRTAAAAKAIASIRDDEGLAEAGMIVGAGTVIKVPQVETAFHAGADFVVSPGFSRRVVQHTLGMGMLPLPGVSSATDLMAAVDAGATDVNVFPAAASGGSAAIRALSAPFGDVRFVPTGGISASNAAEYLAIPSVAAVGTSWVVPHRLVKAQDWDGITRIARAATALVRAGDTVGLNGGTTTTEVAREIALLPVGIDPDRPVTVVTNAVNIASELTVRQNVRVVVTGGVAPARARSYELTGPLSDLILPRISVDTTFLGVDGMDATGAYAFHEGEAAVNYALARAAQRVVVVADHTKLSKSTFALICRADEINMLITDIGATEEQLAPIRRAGITIRQV